VTLRVSDSRSNFNEQIVYAAERIGRSVNKAAVFRAVYTGKQKTKSRDEIAELTGLSMKQVLVAGKALADAQLVQQTKKDGQTAYEKDLTFAPYRDRILRLAVNREAREAVPTKRTRTKQTSTTITVRAPRSSIRATRLTLDDIESFNDVHGVAGSSNKARVSEAVFKNGVKDIIGEPGVFKDWGGETNDLYTTRLTVAGRRLSCAFAFKGPGTTGKLTPGKMGKNGDQIIRLFSTPADVYLLQYWATIDQSVHDEMKAWASYKSALENREVFFGLIDGLDSSRLLDAYPAYFGL
jgi:hypothetical protein